MLIVYKCKCGFEFPGATKDTFSGVLRMKCPFCGIIETRKNLEIDEEFDRPDEDKETEEILWT